MICANNRFYRCSRRSSIVHFISPGTINSSCCGPALFRYHTRPGHGHCCPRTRSPWSSPDHSLCRTKWRPISRLGDRATFAPDRQHLELYGRRQYHAPAQRWPSQTDFCSHLGRLAAEDGSFGTRGDSGDATTCTQCRSRSALLIPGHGGSGDLQRLRYVDRSGHSRWRSDISSLAHARRQAWIFFALRLCLPQRRSSTPPTAPGTT